MDEEPLRLRKQVHAAKRQQRDNQERERPDYEHPYDGWTDLGFHAAGRKMTGHRGERSAAAARGNFGENPTHPGAPRHPSREGISKTLP
jgi:hypothetical protein